MGTSFTIKTVLNLFPTDETCLEEIKKLRFPQGIRCVDCEEVTKHYKLQNRNAYACEYCRHQVYPLKGTIFEKSTTPLQIWFFSLFLMTITHGKISAKALQRETYVTYKTAWRMRQNILHLMKQNHGDLLKGPDDTISVSFFNAFELKITHRQEVS